MRKSTFYQKKKKKERKLGVYFFYERYCMSCPQTESLDTTALALVDPVIIAIWASFW